MSKKGDAMGLFTKKIGTVFLKENSDVEAYIEKLFIRYYGKMKIYASVTFIVQHLFIIGIRSRIIKS